jgi:hypothetical protein
MAATLPEAPGARHSFAAARPRDLRSRTVSPDVEALLDAMAAQQEAKVLALARRLVPHVTPEDLRNPHDFVPLVESAEFNYEDGILAGLRAAAVAIRAARRAPPG